MSKNYKKLVDEVAKTLDFEKNNYQLKFVTSMGDITLDFFPDRAPKHVTSMIGLAKNGFYDGLNFHRIIDGFVIQGGCPDGNGTGGPGYNVEAEFNDYPHTLGVLSMARAQDPNSAGSQFFLCLGDVPYLNNNYTVFGKTSDEASTDVVQKIGKVKTDGDDRPLDEVKINSAEVIETAK